MAVPTGYAEHLKLRKAGKVEPWVFFRMVADKRGARNIHDRFLRLQKRGGLPASPRAVQDEFTRPAPNGRQEHGASRSPRTHRNTTQRTQNAIGVRALQHRLERRPSRSCYAASRTDRDKKGTVRDSFADERSETSKIANVSLEAPPGLNRGWRFCRPNRCDAWLRLLVPDDARF